MVFVVLMGMGTVFFGLICIIFLTQLMGKVVGGSAAKPAPAAAASVAAPAAAVAEAEPEEVKPEILAVITAVLSEESDTSSNGVNIVNIKRKSTKAVSGQGAEPEVVAAITAVLSDEIGNNDVVNIKKI